MFFEDFLGGLTPGQTTMINDALEEEQQRKLDMLQQAQADAFMNRGKVNRLGDMEGVIGTNAQYQDGIANGYTGGGDFEMPQQRLEAPIPNEQPVYSPEALSLTKRRPTAPAAGPGFFEDLGNQAAAKLFTDTVMGSMFPQAGQPSAPAAPAAGPGFFGDVFGQAAKSMPVPVPIEPMQGLGRNEQGPLAPGQHRGDFTLGNHGVRIWNGDNAGPAPMMLPEPGAGYTAKNVNTGEMEPMAYPTDALFGQRTAVIDPYTNPIVWQQDRMLDKEQGLRREMANLTSATRLDEAGIRAEGMRRAAEARGRKVEDIRRIVTDPLLSDAVKVAEINKREDFDPVDKNRSILDLTTSKVNPTTKGRDSIPHTDAKGKSQLDVMLGKVPDGIPPEEIMSFLEDWRGVPKESLLKKAAVLQDIGGTSHMTEQQKKEYEQLARLGIMPKLPAKKPVTAPVQDAFDAMMRDSRSRYR